MGFVQIAKELLCRSLSPATPEGVCVLRCPSWALDPSEGRMKLQVLIGLAASFSLASLPCHSCYSEKKKYRRSITLGLYREREIKGACTSRRQGEGE